ncbi:MAG: hypothetical protein IPL52_10370 [Flavobacteriales bacterium]|nr:hypothetical protein [Flavobacteriales bacterium]
MDDGTCDAQDGCPNDPDKTAPGNCGCGNPNPVPRATMGQQHLNTSDWCELSLRRHLVGQ